MASRSRNPLGPLLSPLALLLALACAGAETVPPTHGANRQSGTRGQRDFGPSRSEDGHPYLFPRNGRLRLFRCRWDTEAPIGVYIDGTESAVAGVRLALAAWEELDLGLRFYEVLPSEAALSITIHDEPVETASGPGTGRAVADCLVRESPEFGAALISARVDIARKTPPDARDRVRDLTEEEFVGAAVHELGHALGYQGHSRKSGAAIVRDRFVTKQLGKRALAGERISAPGVEGLYQQVAGATLEDIEVEGWRTDLVDRMARLAKAEELAGPFVRVGDTAARIFWRAENGREYGLQVPQIEKVLARPDRFLLIPEAATRSALPRSNDRGPEDP